MTRVLVVPGTLALLPSYAGLDDPIPELRDAVADGIDWLTDRAATVHVVGDPPSAVDKARGIERSVAERLGDALLAGLSRRADADRVLVVANGSAMRTEKAPGHLDPRAEPFDLSVEAALRAGDATALASIDHDLGDALWAVGLRGLTALARLGMKEAELLYADDPYGVRYWVATWVTAGGATPTRDS